MAWALFALACSDEGGEEQRASVLDSSPQRIAVDALSDAPSADYLKARRAVAGRLAPERVQHSRTARLGAGSGATIVSDPIFNQARLDAAAALRTTLDPSKVGDVASAQAGIDALLAEVVKLSPGAVSCESLGGTKADDCAFALIIIEVQRSEWRPNALDAGAMPVADTGVADAGTDAGDGGARDSGSPDSGPSVVTEIECGARDTTGARMVPQTIEADEVWSGKVLVGAGRTIVRSATITIMPGTEIFMDVDSVLEVGWNTTEAAIIADGTAAAPIRFCGKTADPGFWGGILIQSNVTSNSVLRNVLIAEGGGTDAALVLDADITIDNVQVRRSGLDGVWASDFKADSRALTVENSGRSPVVLEAEGALTRFPLGGGFRANADNVARIRFNGLEGNAVAHDLGIPYLQEMNVLQRGGELTIEAGVEYRLAPDGTLEIGWNTASAGFHVNGTAEAPVVFTSAGEATSQWGGIVIGNNVTTNSNLSYVEIRHGGAGGQPVLEVDAAIRVEHVRLHDNATGMAIGETGLAPNSTQLSITTTAGRPLSVATNGIFALPTGGSFTGNMIDQIEVVGNGIDKSGTIHDLGIPYFLTGDVLVRGTVTLTIAAGTDFVMGPDSSLVVGWNSGASTIIANGAAGTPITFTGADAVAGYWDGLILERGVLSNSVLNYLEIGQAGKSTGGALELNAAIPVTNSRIYQSAGYGIIKPASNTVDYLPTNTFEAALGPVGMN